MDEENSKPIAKGVVVFVDNQMNYGIIHASGYERVLIAHNFNKEIVQLGNWLSVEVELNTGPILTFDRTRCRFADASPPEVTDELLPTGTSVSKTGAISLRIQTPVFSGNITFGSSVGLSPHLGRVYLNESLCNKFSPKPLTWIHCGVVSAEPSETNYNSFWEARTAAREDELDPKYNSYIRRCLGRFYRFQEKNICILQLFSNQKSYEGFAYVHSFDFAHTVREGDLKKARAIQVYVAPQLFCFSELPVPACYARIVDDGVEETGVETTEQKLINLQIDAMDDNTVRESGMESTTNDSVEKVGEVCSTECETIDLISRMLAFQSVAKHIEEVDFKLFSDLRAFIASNS